MVSILPCLSTIVLFLELYLAVSVPILMKCVIQEGGRYEANRFTKATTARVGTDLSADRSNEQINETLTPAVT
jgi:hypothetical protein